ncbi:hypothetical protein L195_g007287 [Trifolium pratense]|uniref:SURF1-like protein n=1 Tax=Trifolium pratense TaxID=57577 RepID=A0A2K3P5Z0_TRIPR|nr:hypothetical protein L195_g007287 [Trifolium pratense]
MPSSTSTARTLAELRRVATSARGSTSSDHFLAVRPFSSTAPVSSVSNSDPTLSSSSDSNGKASKWWLYLPGAIAFGLGSWQIVRREEKPIVTGFAIRFGTWYEFGYAVRNPQRIWYARGIQSRVQIPCSGTPGTPVLVNSMRISAYQYAKVPEFGTYELLRGSPLLQRIL